MTTTSFSCRKKVFFPFSAHYFTTALPSRQPLHKNFTGSYQKEKAPDDIFRIIRHFFQFLLLFAGRRGAFHANASGHSIARPIA